MIERSTTDSRDCGELSLPEKASLQIAIIGTPDHEGRMCGRAFEILGRTPVYIEPARPVIPTDPSPDVVVISREWSIDIRHAAMLARRQDIPVVYVMDGVIEWAYFWENWGFVKPEGTVLQPLIADELCVIGQHPARILAAQGLADRIHIVGLPRLDGLNRQRMIDPDGPLRIVIATAKTFGHNTAHKVYVRAALRDLKEWFNRHPEVAPVWRISRELAAELAVEPSLHGEMVDVLRNASGVISFTSTVLLEAMLLGIPTAQIDYRPVPQYFETAWEVRCAEHLDGVIQELFFPPPEKLALQEACLHDELQVGDASARLAALLRETAAGRRDSVSSAQPAISRTTGQLDFRQIHSHLSAFAVSPASRLQYELDATYRLWERDRQQMHDLHRDIGQVAQEPWIRILQKLDWLPGFRRTARALKRLKRHE